MGKFLLSVILAAAMCLSASSQTYRIGAGSKILFDGSGGVTNFLVNGTNYTIFTDAFYAMPGAGRWVTTNQIASITNGAASIAYVDSATNGGFLLSTNAAVQDILARGYATTGQVNSVWSYLGGRTNAWDLTSQTAVTNAGAGLLLSGRDLAVDWAMMLLTNDARYVTQAALGASNYWDGTAVSNYVPPYASVAGSASNVIGGLFYVAVTNGVATNLTLAGATTVSGVQTNTGHLVVQSNLTAAGAVTFNGTITASGTVTATNGGFVGPLDASWLTGTNYWDGTAVSNYVPPYASVAGSASNVIGGLFYVAVTNGVGTNLTLAGATTVSGVQTNTGPMVVQSNLTVVGSVIFSNGSYSFTGPYASANTVVFSSPTGSTNTASSIQLVGRGGSGEIYNDWVVGGVGFITINRALSVSDGTTGPASGTTIFSASSSGVSISYPKPFLVTSTTLLNGATFSASTGTAPSNIMTFALGDARYLAVTGTSNNMAWTSLPYNGSWQTNAMTVTGATATNVLYVGVVPNDPGALYTASYLAPNTVLVARTATSTLNPVTNAVTVSSAAPLITSGGLVGAFNGLVSNLVNNGTLTQVGAATFNGTITAAGANGTASSSVANMGTIDNRYKRSVFISPRQMGIGYAGNNPTFLALTYITTTVGEGIRTLPQTDPAGGAQKGVQARAVFPFITGSGLLIRVDYSDMWVSGSPSNILYTRVIQEIYTNSDNAATINISGNRYRAGYVPYYGISSNFALSSVPIGGTGWQACATWWVPVTNATSVSNLEVMVELQSGYNTNYIYGVTITDQ